MTQNNTIQCKSVHVNVIQHDAFVEINRTTNNSFNTTLNCSQNFSLKRVCLDGNPIGVQGAKALMTISMEAGDRVEVRMCVCACVRVSECSDTLSGVLL